MQELDAPALRRVLLAPRSSRRKNDKGWDAYAWGYRGITKRRELRESMKKII